MYLNKINIEELKSMIISIKEGGVQRTTQHIFLLKKIFEKNSFLMY